MKDTISIASYSVSDNTSKSLGGGHSLTDIIKPVRQTTNVNVETVKANMAQTISKLLEIFEMKELESEHFEVDEIEVALTVGGEGSVSILSAVSAQVNTQSSIVVKVKRKKDDKQ